MNLIDIQNILSVANTILTIQAKVHYVPDYVIHDCVVKTGLSDRNCRFIRDTIQSGDWNNFTLKSLER